MVFALELIQREISSVQEYVPQTEYLITTGREHLQLFRPAQGTLCPGTHPCNL